ncbi:hypothetical protein TNCV_1576871 [Trichonephila clavipes]|nr:hypothetical protein TNCV_1576871 [Trichonephila clavipes]
MVSLIPPRCQVISGLFFSNARPLSNDDIDSTIHESLCKSLEDNVGRLNHTHSQRSYYNIISKSFDSCGTVNEKLIDYGKIVPNGWDKLVLLALPILSVLLIYS